MHDLCFQMNISTFHITGSRAASVSGAYVSLCRDRTTTVLCQEARWTENHLSELAKVSFRHKMPSMQSIIASVALKLRTSAMAKPASKMMA